MYCDFSPHNGNVPKATLPRLLVLAIISTLGVFLVQSLGLAANLPQAANIQPINPDELTGEYVKSEVSGEFLDRRVASVELPDAFATKVLGDSDVPKRIEVDLAHQMLYAYEGDKLVYNFLISSGKWGRTPTGTFQIWGKFRYTKMEGGSKALHTYYYLPNVPYVMFFSNDEIVPSRGFSLHGTYWHENFGHPMSHGCINMKTEEVAQLYAWAGPDIGEAKSGRATDENPGTEVIIFGEAPEE